VGVVLSAVDGIFGAGVSVEKRFYLFSTLDGLFVVYTIMILLSKKCNQTVPLFDHIQYVDYIGLFENYN